MNLVNKDQIKIIHVLKSKLQLCDDDYRSMLSGYRNARSSTDLSFSEAKDFIQLLVDMADKKGIPTPMPAKAKAHNGYAYPAQLYKIKMLWFSKSYMPTDKKKEKALNNFLSNKFKISRIEWLPRDMVGKVIKAIECIKDKAQEVSE